MSKSAGAPVAGIKLFHDLELNLFNRDEHHLCNAFTGLNFVAVTAAIPAGDKHLPLVVRVDKACQVTEHESVFVAQP